MVDTGLHAGERIEIADGTIVAAAERDSGAVDATQRVHRPFARAAETLVVHTAVRAPERIELWLHREIDPHARARVDLFLRRDFEVFDEMPAAARRRLPGEHALPHAQALFDRGVPDRVNAGSDAEGFGLREV